MAAKCRHGNPYGYCGHCEDAENRRRQRDYDRLSGSQPKSGWTPRTVGATDDGREVTFREGVGDNEGHTLIADGQKSDREFRRGHNHYGPNREDTGRVEEDRGFYTGPGH